MFPILQNSPWALYFFFFFFFFFQNYRPLFPCSLELNNVLSKQCPISQNPLEVIISKVEDIGPANVRKWKKRKMCFMANSILSHFYLSQRAFLFVNSILIYQIQYVLCYFQVHKSREGYKPLRWDAMRTSEHFLQRPCDERRGWQQNPEGNWSAWWSPNHGKETGILMV